MGGIYDDIMMAENEELFYLADSRLTRTGFIRYMVETLCLNRKNIFISMLLGLGTLFAQTAFMSTLDLFCSPRNNPDTNIDGMTFLEPVTLDEALDLTRKCTFITEAYYPYEIIHANAGKFLTHLLQLLLAKEVLLIPSFPAFPFCLFSFHKINPIRPPRQHKKTLPIITRKFLAWNFEITVYLIVPSFWIFMPFPASSQPHLVLIESFPTCLPKTLY